MQGRIYPSHLAFPKARYNNLLKMIIHAALLQYFFYAYTIFSCCFTFHNSESYFGKWLSLNHAHYKAILLGLQWFCRLGADFLPFFLVGHDAKLLVVVEV